MCHFTDFNLENPSTAVIGRACDSPRTLSLPELNQWPSEELAHIRSVLRKVSAQRIRNPDDAEDLVQDTFLTMTEKLRKAQLEKGLLVWGMAILRRKVGNYYRREQRCVPLAEEILSDQSSTSVLAPAQAESELHSAEIRELIEGLLEDLAPAECDVLRKILAGSSIQEIARLYYPEPYQNIVNRVHRGRRKLSEKLRKYGYHVTFRKRAAPRK